MKVYEVLEMVSQGEFPSVWAKDIGLCNQNWYFMCGIEYHKVKEIFYFYFHQWDEFSGFEDYPVDDEDGCARGAYHSNRSKYTGMYGESRKRLAGFLAKKLKENENV
ncbi:hypothetical protein ZPAH1_orf00199 [Aeromonas phage ZPAH1]|nr:hypothetical protein ZPAH1_orf00199 [Aeromonas phage ZPAH1]